jgi:hypothetical protein
MFSLVSFKMFMDIEHVRICAHATFVQISDHICDLKKLQK